MACAPLIACNNAPDSVLYSLQDNPLPFTIVCPVGFDCSQSDSITLVCCSSTLSADLSGMTPTQRTNTIIALTEQCLQQSLFCGDSPTEKKIFYFNAPQSCSVRCPDGTIFTYTVPAGAFLLGTLADANALAFAFACQQAQTQLICLGNIPRCLCVGVPYVATLRTTNPPQLLNWSVFGTTPPGLTFQTVRGSTLLINGTPSENGTFTFQIKATGAKGSFMQKSFTLTVLEITTTSIPAYVIGVPYSFQLVAQGGSGNYTWGISAGSLPPGLTLSATGLISGTPLA